MVSVVSKLKIQLNQNGGIMSRNPQTAYCKSASDCSYFENGECDGDNYNYHCPFQHYSDCPGDDGEANEDE